MRPAAKGCMRSLPEAGVDQRKDKLCELPDCELARVADVDQAGYFRPNIHQPHEILSPVTDEAERGGLLAVPVKRDVPEAPDLRDKVRHNRDSGASADCKC